jgi:hypothetical protein
MQYGKLNVLLGNIPECISVFDQATPSNYSFAGGVIFCNFFNGHIDLFDLDNAAGAAGLHGLKPLAEGRGVGGRFNPAIKALVINFMWGGYPSKDLAKAYPTIVVGREQANVYREDPQNLMFMDHAVIADSLETAMEFAYKATATNNVIIFDGVFGGLNVSESLAKVLFEKAPEVERKVERELLPKWLKQRQLEIPVAAASLTPDLPT